MSWVENIVAMMAPNVARFPQFADKAALAAAGVLDLPTDPETVRVDEYEARNGYGFVIVHTRVNGQGKTEERRLNYGPDESLHQPEFQEWP